MIEKERIYLDNAATTWPKPESVYAAVNHYLRHIGAPAGRGAYHDAVESSRIVQQLRQNLGKLCNAPGSTNVIFGFNGTDVLNIAMHGVLRPGDHVIATNVDHNSVLRPLETLKQRGLIEVTYVATNATGVIRAQDVANELRDETRLVALPHASNVTGVIQPMAQVADIVADSEAFFLVDAAQTLGHLVLDLADCPIDFLASSGHKGLLGPLGTGVLFISEQAASEIEPLKQGGTGSDSQSPLQPTSLPERLESGSLNVPGLAGLLAGVEYVLHNQFEIRSVEHDLTASLLAGLESCPQVTVVGPANPDERVGVVSFMLENVDPQELANVLDSVHGIQVRSGLQCAPRMHQNLGTFDRGGTIRASLGPFNRRADVEALVRAVQDYAQVAT